MVTNNIFNLGGTACYHCRMVGITQKNIYIPQVGNVISGLCPLTRECIADFGLKFRRGDCADHVKTEILTSEKAVVPIQVSCTWYMRTYKAVVCLLVKTLCVCVFFPFIPDIKFVGRTSRGHTGGRSHRISHPSSSCKSISPKISLLLLLSFSFNVSLVFLLAEVCKPTRFSSTAYQYSELLFFSCLFYGQLKLYDGSSWRG